jgi:hypothetical protein
MPAAPPTVKPTLQFRQIDCGVGASSEDAAVDDQFGSGDEGALVAGEIPSSTKP